MINKKYDVFIAYHGSYDQQGGSLEYARTLYQYLTKKNIRCFFFPESAPTGNYKANIKEILESNLFILVCTKGIKVEKSGKISIKQHFNLYSEIDTFWGLTQTGDVKFDNSVVLAVGSDFIKGAESQLHPLFYDRNGLFCDQLGENELNSVYEWVKGRLDSMAIDDGQSYEIKKLYSKRRNIRLNVLQNMVASAKQITCIGISNSIICNMNMQDSVIEFLNNGGKLDVFFLDPDGKNTKQRAAEEGVRFSGIASQTKTNFDNMLDVILRNCKNPENARLYLYDLVPRINALIVDNILILEYYSYNQMGKDNPAFYIEKSDNQNSPLFDNTQITCDYIMKHAKERRDYYEGV